MDDGTPPIWGGLVGLSSSGNTEVIEALRKVGTPADDLSPPGLLSWSRGKTPRPVRLLTRIGSLGFVLVADFSTMLASDDKRAEETLFSALRRVYDGRYDRWMGERSRRRGPGG